MSKKNDTFNSRCVSKGLSTERMANNANEWRERREVIASIDAFHDAILAIELPAVQLVIREQKRAYILTQR